MYAGSDDGPLQWGAYHRPLRQMSGHLLIGGHQEIGMQRLSAIPRISQQHLGIPLMGDHCEMFGVFQCECVTIGT